MVYPGRLSRGCSRCKQRKLKCDETKPSCTRCLKYGKPCPGYEKNLVIRQEGTKFQVQDPSSGAVAVLPKPGRSHRGSSSSGSSSGSSGSGSYSQHIIDPNDFISTSLGVIPSWDSEALGYFMHQYVLPEANDCSGYLHFLPKTYLESPESSSIRVAVKASAYLSLYRYSKTKEHEIQAHTWHHHAIRGLLEQLRSGHEATSEETVVTMILLSIFDDIDGRGGHQKINPHLNGLIHILQRSNRSLINAPFFSWVRQQLIIKSFTADYHIVDPSWVTPSANPNPHLDNFRVVAVRVNQFMTSGRQLLAKLKQVNDPANKEPLMSPVELKAQLLAVIQEATSIQHEIDEWISTIPRSDKWGTMCKNGKPSVYIFSSRYLGCYWINVFTTVIILQGSVIACYDILLTMTRSSVDLNLIMAKSKSGSEAKTMLTHIHKSIPFSMGNIDQEGTKIFRPESRSAYGCLLVWPLGVLARCRLSGDVEVRDARAALEVISSTMGVDLAHWVLNEWRSPLYPFIQ
ncbi:hypothetical protein V2G26_009624 [Clonostachys chloroleuca]